MLSVASLRSLSLQASHYWNCLVQAGWWAPTPSPDLPRDSLKQASDSFQVLCQKQKPASATMPRQLLELWLGTDLSMLS